MIGAGQTTKILVTGRKSIKRVQVAMNYCGFLETLFIHPMGG
jgi:hypothetical protein